MYRRVVFDRDEVPRTAIILQYTILIGKVPYTFPAFYAIIIVRSCPVIIGTKIVDLKFLSKRSQSRTNQQSGRKYDSYNLPCLTDFGQGNIGFDL